MSTNYLKIFPVNMDFVPSTLNIQKSTVLIEKYIEHGEIDTDITNEIMLMDIGDNLEAIICPECNCKNTINYFEDGDIVGNWWESIEAAVEETPAFGVKTTMPCCGKVIDFTSLSFQMPSGFARFSFCCCDPDDLLSNDQLKELGSILECSLKQVWARY